MKQALEEKQTQIKDMTFEREKSFHDINQLQIVLSARDREIESLQVAQSGLFWEATGCVPRSERSLLASGD